MTSKSPESGSELESGRKKVNSMIVPAEPEARHLGTVLTGTETYLSHLPQLDQKERHLLDEILQIRQRIDIANHGGSKFDELVKGIEIVEALRREESELWTEHRGMQSELLKLETSMSPVNERICGIVDVQFSLSDPSSKLNSAKKDLAAKLRMIMSLKRQLDDVPAQTELIQYERRFSELYAQIQEKHRQTHKHYATYNVLMEIKELMLKETSLLNSIDSQFQDAMTSMTGRSKLVDSMDTIVKGAQQKLQKVQLGLLKEKKNCDYMKEKHDIAIAEQRQFSSLLKAFQEECARNDRLREQTS